MARTIKGAGEDLRGQRFYRAFGPAKVRGVEAFEEAGIKGWVFDLKRVSSNTPVEHRMGKDLLIREILEHDSLGNIDLARLERGAVNGLNGHGGDVFATAVPGSARVEDGALRFKAKIADDGGLGAQIARQWQAGVGTTLSIGYSWVDYKREEREDDEGRQVVTFRVSKFELFEFSRVGIPADETAQARDALTAISQTATVEDITMADETNTDQKERGAPETATPVIEVKDRQESGDYAVAVRSADELREGAQSRAKALVEQHLGKHSEAVRGKAVGEIVAEMHKTAGELPSYGKRKKREAVRAMDDKVFSILLRHAIPQSAPNAKPADARDEGELAETTVERSDSKDMLERQRLFERENRCQVGVASSLQPILAGERGGSKTARQRGAEREWMEDFLSRACTSDLRSKFENALGERGVMFSPREVAEWRNAKLRQQTANPSDNKGDELIETDVRYELYQEALYGSAMLKEAGATQMMGLTSNWSVPVQTAGINATFLAETGAIQSTDFGIGNVTLTPHRLAIAVPVTLQLQIQSGGVINSIVRQQMLDAFESDMENACLNGNGTDPNPRGLRNWSGVGSMAHGTNGGNPTWQSTLAYEETILNENIKPNMNGEFSFLTTPGAERYRRGTPRGGTGGDMPIWSDARDGRGYNVVRATLLPRNLTKGTGTNLHSEVVGRFSDFLTVTFGMPFVTVDGYTKIRQGIEEVIVQSFMDCAVLRTKSFVISNDVDVS